MKLGTYVHQQRRNNFNNASRQHNLNINAAMSHFNSDTKLPCHATKHSLTVQLLASSITTRKGGNCNALQLEGCPMLPQ